MGCHCSKATDTLHHGLSDTIASDLIQHFFVSDIKDYFTFHEVLGKGSFGYVSRVTCKQTGQDWAVKIVDLENEVDRTALRNELNMLKRLQHI